MKSLYGRLFHAGSAQRDRLEDFLTETLADLLNRLPDRQKRNFCTNFLLKGTSVEKRNAWLALSASAGRLVWKSQESIAAAGVQKRPDLVLYHCPATPDHDHATRRTGTLDHGQVPVMIIECKVGAKFATEQLPYYDLWLAENAGSSAALVVLTHRTDPPDDFLDNNIIYKTQSRSVRRWSELYSWLAEELNVSFWKAESPEASILLKELLQFMREEGLMTEEPTLQDLAAARLYLFDGAHMRIATFIRSVRNAVRSRYKNLRGWPDRLPALDSEPEDGYAAIQDWCEFHKGIYVGWGIRFGEGFFSPDMEPRLSRADSGVVYIEFEQRRVTRPPRNKFAAWHFPTLAETEEFYVGKVVDLHEFGDKLTAGFSSWLISSLEEAKEIIETVLTKEKSK